MAFECPRGTRFEQRTMTCHHYYNVKCESSADFYHMNLRIGQRNLKLIDGRLLNQAKLIIKLLYIKRFSDPFVFMQVVLKNDEEKQRKIRRKPKFMQVVVKDDTNAKSATRPTFGPVTSKRPTFGPVTSTRRPTFGPRNKSKQGQRNKLVRNSNLFFNEVTNPRPRGRNRRRNRNKGRFPNFPPFNNNINKNKKNKSPRPTPSLGFFVEPPSKNAPIANFRGDKKLLPDSHPLTTILPPSSRVVGVRPLRPQLPLSNRQNDPAVMTLNEFLTKFPNMNNVQAIPVPVKGTEAGVIRHLAHSGVRQGQSRNADFVLDELDSLVAARASRGINNDKNNNKIDQKVTVQPRGGKERFENEPIVKVPSQELEVPGPSPAPPFITAAPKLEFGFQPLTASTKQPRTSSTTELNSIEDGEEDDALFFFTTTEAPKLTPSTGEVKFGQKTKPKTSLTFDMRNLFYIPKEEKKPSIIPPSFPTRRSRFKFSP